MMTHIGEGRFLHTFKPKTTNTLYQFEANGVAEMEEGERYNIGFREDKMVVRSSTCRVFQNQTV
ncbi:hypothetical protein SIO17_09500 [Pseudoalteromonas piscicida]|nr:hypothetical protein [Pseudoalteromonas piscicida]WPU33921.1 hypothetical protein SIO17_09500 [Pseudoalteromonas piscicida]